MAGMNEWMNDAESNRVLKSEAALSGPMWDQSPISINSVERYTVLWIYPDRIPFQARVCPTSGPDFTLWRYTYAIVLVDQWQWRHPGPRMVLMRRTFFQINFQDLAAEFAKKKHESFTTLTSHHAQCRLTMLRFLGCCRGMYIVSHIAGGGQYMQWHTLSPWPRLNQAMPQLYIKLIFSF